MAAPLVTVIVTETGFERLRDPQTMLRAETDLIESSLALFAPLARQTAPRRTGRGASTIRAKRDYEAGHPIGRVYPTQFYLRILNVGARWKGPIEPKRNRNPRARALRIPGIGFRARVNHPPLAARRWIEAAAQAGEGQIPAMADAILERHLNGS